MNPKVVQSIYKDDYPSLDDAHIISVNLDWGGPQANITFIAKNFPLHPPEKWINQSYNTVNVILGLISVEYVKISGWDRENLMNIQLFETASGVLRFLAKNNYTEIDIGFRFLDIRISGYKTEDEDAQTSHPL